MVSDKKKIGLRGGMSLFILFMFYFDQFYIVPVVGTISKPVIIIFIFVSLVSLVLKQRLYKLDNIYISSLMFVCYSIFAIIWSESNNGYIEFIELIVLYLFSFFLYQLYEERRTLIGTSISVAMYSSVSISIIIIINLLNNAQGLIGRFGVGDFNVNFLGVLLCVGVSASLYDFKESNLKHFIVAFIILGIFLTGSRTSLAIAILIYSCHVFVFDRRSSILLFVLILITVYFFYISGNVDMTKINIDRYFLMLDEIKSGNLSGRGELWHHALSIFHENILFGSGFDSFKYLMINTMGMKISTHNSYLSVLSNLGVIGFLFYILILFQLVKNCLLVKGKHLRFFLLSCFFTYSISTFTLSWEYGKLFWLLIPLITSGSKDVKEDNTYCR